MGPVVPEWQDTFDCLGNIQFLHEGLFESNLNVLSFGLSQRIVHFSAPAFDLQTTF